MKAFYKLQLRIISAHNFYNCPLKHRREVTMNLRHCRCVKLWIHTKMSLHLRWCPL